ncbi:MAG: twin-arginine translocase subunit TatC [Candidatus Dadabacteria bacterium]|nr:MAG: twin-arginine translocase subunit TatC [Candidatus Dadabacteria bacterium]
MSHAERVPDDARDVPMPLTDHLAELRHRLMVSVAAVFVGFLAAYSQAEVLFDILLEPLKPILPENHGELVFTGLTEPFLVYIKVGLLGGVLLALPVILTQVWLFVRPAFRGNEERYATAFVFFGSLLFVVGALFGYFLVFPFGFRFLIEFAGQRYLPMLTIGSYLTLATKMLVAFGLMFETPLALLFVARLGLVDASFLRRNRKYAVLLIFIIGAVLTPPDVFTQLMLATPLLILYEVSIILVAIAGPRREVDADDDVPDSDGTAEQDPA